MITEALPRLHLEDGNFHLTHADLVVVAGSVQEIIVDEWRVFGRVTIL